MYLCDFENYIVWILKLPKQKTPQIIGMWNLFSRFFYYRYTYHSNYNTKLHFQNKVSESENILTFARRLNGIWKLAWHIEKFSRIRGFPEPTGVKFNFFNASCCLLLTYSISSNCMHEFVIVLIFLTLTYVTS